MAEYRKKDYQSLVDGSLALTSFSNQAQNEPGDQGMMKTSPQKPHADYQTVGPGLEYYYLGNGTDHGRCSALHGGEFRHLIRPLSDGHRALREEKQHVSISP